MKETKPPKSVDEYISLFPTEIQSKLAKLRSVIKKAAPVAEEKLSYGMPAYTHKGMLLYFAAHTNHIGLYPYPSAMETFRKEITQYRTSKGTIQFPYDEPIPYGLVSDIVKFRLQENIKKDELKRRKKKT